VPFSALLDSIIIASYFLKRILIMTAEGKFKPVPSPWGSMCGLSPSKLK